MVKNESNIVGRFAPSPTGMLHFGSLVTAVASYLFAKSRGGKWLLRMEDLDTPRNVSGSADAILRQLDLLGLYWDGPVVYQSERLELYTDTLQQLIRRHEVYRCFCTRREIVASALLHTASGPVYNGHCRYNKHNIENNSTQHGSWRLKVTTTPVTFTDMVHGKITQCPATEVGDFILKRSDNIFAYQFATPLDDAEQYVNQVIRGADLLDSTPRQLYLLQRLRKPVPTFGHIPLVLDAQGKKISKSTQITSCIYPAAQLPFGCIDIFRVLEFLGQNPPLVLQHGNPETLLDWAIIHFKPQSIPEENMCIDKTEGRLHV